MLQSRSEIAHPLTIHYLYPIAGHSYVFFGLHVSAKNPVSTSKFLGHSKVKPEVPPDFAGVYVLAGFHNHLNSESEYY